MVLKVRSSTQIINRIFMSDEVRRSSILLETTNSGEKPQVSVCEILDWGAQQTPPWRVVGVSNYPIDRTVDTWSMIYLVSY